MMTFKTLNPKACPEYYNMFGFDYCYMLANIKESNKPEFIKAYDDQMETVI